MNAEANPDILNLSAPRQVKQLLEKHGIMPQRRLGQHFLVDANILAKIVRAAALGPDTGVLEIGPGLGTLTRELAARAGRVVAVEADSHLRSVLEETLALCENVTLIWGDALKVDLEELCPPSPGREWQVVANLPYYITGPLLARLLELGTVDGRPPGRFRRLVVMIQQEVARRLVADPGTPDYGAFSLKVRYHARAEMVTKVGPRCFFPPPEVGSAVVALTVHDAPPVEADPAILFGLIRAAFAQRRKSLRNALAGAPLAGPAAENGKGLDGNAAERLLERAGIDPRRRGETLSLQEFALLARFVSEAKT